MVKNSSLKVAFIQNITEPLMGYMSMSAYLKENGHTCEVFVENFEQGILKEVKAYDPDVIGYYCVTGNANFGESFMRSYKTHNPQCLTLMGGPHPTYEPMAAATDGIDAAVMGEGEGALLDICNFFDGGVDSIAAINNVCTYRDGQLRKNPLRPLIENLDSLPIPDRALYDKYSYFRNLNTFPVMCSRGCPFNCSYCYSDMMKKLYNKLGRYVRFRSPEHIIREIELIKDRYKNFSFIHFDDSTFNSLPDWVNKFLSVYEDKCRAPFFCTLRVDLATEAQVKFLSEANCKVVAFAIEAGSYRLRKEVLGRDMTDEQIFNVAAWVKKYGLKFTTANIFGIPTETLAETWKLVELNQRIRPDGIASHIFQPYPGTQLGQKAKELGIIDDFDISKLDNYYYRSILKQEGIREQERVHKLLYYLARWPNRTPLWKWLIQHAPFSFLYFMFLLGLSATYKRNTGYTWPTFIYYSILNTRAFSIFKFGKEEGNDPK